MIRLEAGMPTSRFVRLVGDPERSYRRWQQRQRQGRPVKGPWPASARDRVEPVAITYADRFPAWGHRKIAMLMRVDGHRGPDSTVLRALKRTGRVLPVDYQAERRQQAQARRAAFVVPPSGPNQVWQLDFSEFESRHGGTWRTGGIADYWSKLELGWQVATTANHRDAIETVEQALSETERLTGRPLVDLLTDPATGEIRPLVVATDNGPCFKSVRFAAYIERRPELTHIRTRRKSPGSERRPRARLRLAEVRAPLPPRDRRRTPARHRSRELPPTLQPDPATRSDRHAPPPRRPPRKLQRPSNSQVNRARTLPIS